MHLNLKDATEPNRNLIVLAVASRRVELRRYPRCGLSLDDGLAEGEINLSSRMLGGVLVYE
ncbi:hypothetical protein DRO51_00615 [Candidatus Bathyarchaeota archaeon]|nr:MAG: hypothetical protein DRO51_00615 [Candidatus Bathyarchaeota archaeon]